MGKRFKKMHKRLHKIRISDNIRANFKTLRDGGQRPLFVYRN